MLFFVVKKKKKKKLPDLHHHVKGKRTRPCRGSGPALLECEAPRRLNPNATFEEEIRYRVFPQTFPQDLPGVEGKSGLACEECPAQRVPHTRGQVPVYHHFEEENFKKRRKEGDKALLLPLPLCCVKRESREKKRL